MEILKVENLNFTYPNQSKKALDDISFEVRQGDFVLICGQSGCGKSTLLRHLKPELSLNGVKSGNIKYLGKDIYSYDKEITTTQIGYVLQNPDAQIVTDKVWHELAFGLENMGLDTQTIRTRVAEMASFFGIQNWFRKDISQLSGGQKQILNLAAIMAMQPKILILDEPTSQLDPIASNNFIETLVRINNELSTTIIIIEHNTEELYQVADKVLIMDDSKLLYCDTPQKVVNQIHKSNKENILKLLPIPSKIYYELETYSQNKKCPLNVKFAKRWLNDSIQDISVKSLKEVTTKENDSKDLYTKDKKVVIELKDVCFKYKKNGDEVLRDVNLKVYENEIYTILGGNGTGKTTTLSIISKLKKHQRGKVLINGKDIKKYSNYELYEENLAILPQNPQSLFVFETIKEDLEEVLFRKNKQQKYIQEEIERITKLLDIEKLLSQHPYDLSGGELQRCALAKIMLSRPKIILLDEPTKGLDSYYKEEIGEVLLMLKNIGTTMIVVTHDIEFSARYSDRCGLFFDGYIVSQGKPREFFLENSFYTTIANRISKEIFEDVLIYEDVIELCKLNMSK